MQIFFAIGSEGPNQVNADCTPETVTVNTIDITPAAAESLAQLLEILGDRDALIYQPEFQAKIRSAMADEAIEDFLYQWETPSELNSNASLPSFPVAGMPPVLRDMVAGVAERFRWPSTWPP